MFSGPLKEQVKDVLFFNLKSFFLALHRVLEGTVVLWFAFYLYFLNA